MKSLADKVSLRIFFCAIYLVWIQQLKQHMTAVNVMTENRAYCGFQGCLQTEKIAAW